MANMRRNFIRCFIQARSGASRKQDFKGAPLSFPLAQATHPIKPGDGERNNVMNIKCPHCGSEYEVEEKYMFRYTKCEGCGKGFVIGASKCKDTAAKSDRNKSAVRLIVDTKGGTAEYSAEAEPVKEKQNIPASTSAKPFQMNFSPAPAKPAKKERLWGGRRIAAVLVIVLGSAIVACGVALALLWNRSPIALNVQRIDDVDADIAWHGEIIDDKHNNRYPDYPKFVYEFTSFSSAVISGGDMGCAYILKSYENIHVAQIFPGEGVLAAFGDNLLDMKIAIVLTPREYKVDGLPLAEGAYVYCGTGRWKITDNLWRTVHVFREMDSVIFRQKHAAILAEVERNEAKCQAERERRLEALRLELERQRQAEEAEEQRRLALMNRQQKVYEIQRLLDRIGTLKDEINDILDGKEYAPFDKSDIRELDNSIATNPEEDLPVSRRFSKDSSDRELDSELERLNRECMRLDSRKRNLMKCHEAWKIEQLHRAETAKKVFIELDINTHYDMHEMLARTYSLEPDTIESDCPDFSALLEKGDYLGILSAASKFAGGAPVVKYPSDDKIIALYDALSKHEFKVKFRWQKGIPDNGFKAIRFAFGSPDKPVEIGEETNPAVSGNTVELNVTLGATTILYPSVKILPQHEFRVGNRPWDDLDEKLNKQMQRKGIGAAGSNEEENASKALDIYLEFVNAVQIWLHPPKLGLSVLRNGKLEKKPDYDAIHKRFMEMINAKLRARKQSIRDRGLDTLKGLHDRGYNMKEMRGPMPVRGPVPVQVNQL